MYVDTAKFQLYFLAHHQLDLREKKKNYFEKKNDKIIVPCNY